MSTYGRVRNKETKRILAKRIEKSGYERVSLNRNGVNRKVAIHRLVAQQFIPNPENKPTVNHIDEDKRNNSVSNLEWATMAEQNSFGTRIQRARLHTDYAKRRIDYTLISEKHDYKKLAEFNSKPVVAMCIKTGEEKKFKSHKEAAENIGCHSSDISQCLSGIRHSTKGYTFTEVSP